MSNVTNALSYGGMVTIVGLLIVFFALILLITLISLLAGAIHKIEAAATKPKEETPAAPVAEVAAPAVEEASEDVVDDTELIAVISAALAAYDNSGKLVVRKVRRVSGWNKSSREEQVARF